MNRQIRLVILLTIGLAVVHSAPIALATQSNAKSCPEWIMSKKESLPICPDGKLVPETYPMAAIVISDSGMTGPDSGFSSDVAERVLMASGKQNPLIVISGSRESFQKVLARIDSLPIDQNTRAKYRKSVVHVNAPSFTWQQDYMQAFINPSTGKVVLREVENYKRHGTAFSDLSKAIAGCGFEVGPALETQRIVSGNGGGNIETLPFGICLLGDDHFKNHLDWRAYATQICQPGLSNSVKVPTYWLTVGHTDEILKVVRNKSKPAPCDFSIAIASPRVAMELLATHKSDKFFEFSNLGYEAGKKGV